MSMSLTDDIDGRNLPATAAGTHDLPATLPPAARERIQQLMAYVSHALEQPVRAGRNVLLVVQGYAVHARVAHRAASVWMASCRSAPASIRRPASSKVCAGSPHHSSEMTQIGRAS